MFFTSKNQNNMINIQLYYKFNRHNKMYFKYIFIGISSIYLFYIIIISHRSTWYYIGTLVSNIYLQSLNRLQNRYYIYTRRYKYRFYFSLKCIMFYTNGNVFKINKLIFTKRLKHAPTYSQLDRTRTRV